MGEGEDARASSSFVDATSKSWDEARDATTETMETPTVTETTMRFVEELEDGATRVVRLFDDDDDDGGDENDARRPRAVLEPPRHPQRIIQKNYATTGNRTRVSCGMLRVLVVNQADHVSANCIARRSSFFTLQRVPSCMAGRYSTTRPWLLRDREGRFT